MADDESLIAYTELTRSTYTAFYSSEALNFTRWDVSLSFTDIWLAFSFLVSRLTEAFSGFYKRYTGTVALALL